MTNNRPDAIVFEVGDYAYGSLTMALSVAERLRGRYRIVCLAHRGVARPLRESGLFSSVREVTEPEVGAALGDLLACEKVRVVCAFSVLTDDTWSVCESETMPLLYLDMHLWRRSRGDLAQLRSRTKSSRLYFESYPGVEDDLRRVGLSSRSLIRPVVGVRGRRPARRSRKIVVSLGGGDSAFVPYHRNPYPAIVSGILKDALAGAAGGREALVCCGERLAEHLNLTANGGGPPVVSLPRDQYLAEVKAASLLITQPSIHSPYEGFLSTVPTILLPPQNFTQYFHLKQWLSWGIGHPSTDPTQLFDGLTLDPRGAEEAQEGLVQAALRSLLSDPARMKRLAALYAGEVTAALEHPADYLRRQRVACERLGWDRGVADVCQLIESAGRVAGRERGV